MSLGLVGLIIQKEINVKKIVSIKRAAVKSGHVSKAAQRRRFLAEIELKTLMKNKFLLVEVV